MRFGTFIGCLAVLGGVFTGCGGETTCYPTGLTGSCCESNGDCTDGLCLTDFPSGYCSRDCSDDHSCPEGDHCLELQGAGGTRVLCLKGCASGQAPCRDGYTCQLATAIDSPVCVPGN